MRYWDTSALVPLLVVEALSAEATARLGDDPEIVTWWGTRVECASALARLERDGIAIDEPLTRLDALASAWHEVEPTDHVRRVARRLLRVHAIRAADALQLAAATVASEGDPSTLAFVCLDDRLVLAASREGFPAPPMRQEAAADLRSATSESIS